MASAVLLLLARHSCVGFDVEGGRPKLPAAGQRPGLPPLAGAGSRPAVASGGGSVSGAVAEASAKVNKWYRAYQGFIAGAAKVSQLISFGCGTWLAISTPFALIGSIIGLKLHEAALVLYLGLFGVLMCGMEVPLGSVQRVLQQYFFILFTRPGRALFVGHVAAIAWTCNHVGFMTKVLMAFNAGLTFYILNSQGRQFAQVDNAALDSASNELRGSVKEALSFGKMFGSFAGFGGKGGGGGGSAGAAGGGAAGGGGGQFVPPTPTPPFAPPGPAQPNGEPGASGFQWPSE